MKEKLLTLAVALLAATGAWAQTFTFDNLKYTVIDATAKTVELTGYVTAPTGTLTIPATVTNESTEYSVTSIGKEAFKKCNGITSVTIPVSVTSIGSSAFISCSSLTAVTISDGVTSIGTSAFSSCSSLTEVNIPASVTNIGIYAFYSCVGLLQLTIGNGVTVIGAYAFEFCEKLQQVTLGNNVAAIGYGAFGNCKQLEQISIPESVMIIGETAFSGCSALTAINVDEANADYCSDGGVLFNKDKTTLIQYPIGKPETSYIIPDGVTSVGGYAFEKCEALTAVTIPVSVTSIGINAFSYCEALTAVTIPDGVTEIQNYTFAYCYSLKSVTIGSGVTSIGKKAFYVCNEITEMTVAATVPPTLGTDVFLNVSRTIPVYVPATLLADYQAADVWSEFNLQAISTTGLQTPAMPESIRMDGGMLHNPQQLHLNLYDMQGRQVYSGNDATVSLNAGVYVVRCNGASGKVLF